MVSTTVSSAEPPDRLNIVDVVRQHTQLTPSAHGQLRGACPGCGSTAFYVRAAHNTFHCFGCGEGGDAATFAARIEHRRI